MGWTFSKLRAKCVSSWKTRFSIPQAIGCRRRMLLPGPLGCCKNSSAAANAATAGSEDSQYPALRAAGRLFSEPCLLKRVLGK
jgi:hypothetical protein